MMNTTTKMMMTDEQLAILRLYTDSTYGIALGPKDAKILEGMGLVQWVPPKFGTTQYAITDKGKQVRDSVV
jgi:hypothetical protein